MSFFFHVARDHVIRRDKEIAIGYYYDWPDPNPQSAP